MERFDEFVERALYDPATGFYATGGRAGRRGDFLTSPEVGPLFGAVIARALDRWWRELGEPDPYVVVDAGAGPGTLARTVRLAAPACTPVLRYVCVERSAAQRELQPDEVERRADLPDEPFTGVVIANELLDNLPFRLFERTAAGWCEVHVDADHDVLVPVDPPPPSLLEIDAEVGARVPVQERAITWLRDALARVDRGRAVVVDYADTTASLARRPERDWLRTYRGHERGGSPLEAPGRQDITVEVAVDQLAAGVGPPHADQLQSEFLVEHGIEALVEEGRRLWEERAHLGDLVAVRARSRITEAAALLDRAGLGSFRVLQWAQQPAAARASQP